MKIIKQIAPFTIVVLSVILSFVFLNFKQKEDGMKNTKEAVIEIVEFTDPACTWCWGSEPILRKLEYRYKEQIKISFVMGGLVEDAHTFMDNKNKIGGDLNSFNKQVGTHWLEASQRHGMPVLAEGFKLFDDENPSTYPMNIAYKAAQFQSEEIANKFLRRMREATAAEAKQTNTMEVLIELAQESGLDIGMFITDMESGKANKAFEEDRYLTRSHRANGFPSFLIKSKDGKEIMLRGYQSFENFKSTINHLSSNELIEYTPSVSEENIIDFIKTFEKVAKVEIKESFDFHTDELDKLIGNLLEKKVIEEIIVGNSFYYQMPKEGAMCDDTGVCNL